MENLFKFEDESGFSGPKNGKTKMRFYIRMLMNGKTYFSASKLGSKFIKNGEIDKFCDEAIKHIEEMRKLWKEIEKEI